MGSGGIAPLIPILALDRCEWLTWCANCLATQERVPRNPMNRNLSARQTQSLPWWMFMSKINFNFLLWHMARPPKWAVFFRCTSVGIRKSIQEMKPFCHYSWCKYDPLQELKCHDCDDIYICQGLSDCIGCQLQTVEREFRVCGSVHLQSLK